MGRKEGRAIAQSRQTHKGGGLASSATYYSRLLPATIAANAPTTAASTPPTTVTEGDDAGALFG